MTTSESWWIRSLCIGCRKCEWACNDENDLPTQELKAFEDKSVFRPAPSSGQAAYTVVNQFADPTEPDKKFTIKVQCMHCNASGLRLGLYCRCA